MARAAAITVVANDKVEVRVSYLRKVVVLTFLALALAAVSGLLAAGVYMLLPFLAHPFIATPIILGSWFGATLVARPLVFSNTPAKWMGLGMGAVLQGVAMGYLLLTAAVTSTVVYGNPVVFIAQAMGLTGIAVLGMVAYVMTGPKELSYVKGAVAILAIPMMILMALSFVSFAAGLNLFGGVFGTVMTGLFVVVSGMGLLVEVNKVTHELHSEQYVEGSYLVTIGVLVLFWNLLVLLMRLQRR